MTPPAAKTRIPEGKSNVDLGQINFKKNPEGKYRHTLSVRTWGGRLRRTTIEARTIGEWRRKAEAKKQAWLAASPAGSWTPATPVERYIDNVVTPAIDSTDRLKDLSKKRYRAALALVRGELKGYSIHDASQFRTLEAALQAIATTAPGSVSTARTVMSSYLLDNLIRDGLVPANPLRGARLDLPTAAPTKAPTGRRTLTRAEWDTVVKHLLERDTDRLLTPTKHKNLRKSTRNIHARAVRLMLLQAVTGLRIAEANLVQWRHVIEEGDHLLIDATSDVVKGRKGKEKGRFIPVLRDDVAAYLREHRGEKDEYVVGAPSSTTIPWDPTNSDDSVPELYRQVAEATGVGILAGLRSHSWRATLHGVYADRIDPATRASIFGHTETVAAEYYNDRRNIESLLRTIRA